MKRLYRSLLLLYPKEYRAIFAAEMQASFERGFAEQRGLALARFTIAEIAGLLKGAAAERFAKMTSSAYMNRLCLSERMRPANVTREEWWPAGAAVPEDLIEAQNRVELNLNQMVHALATHDFAAARDYSNEDLRAREDLRILRRRYGRA
jgi:hypothetical protein